MKKTLLICGQYPLPENVGTNIRAMNFIRYFSQYGPVDVAYSDIPSDVQSGSPIFRNEFYLQRRHFQGKYKHYFLRLIKRLPLPVDYFTRDSSKLLRSLIIGQNYDYILVRYVMNTEPVLALPLKYKLRTIIDFDDIVSNGLYELHVGNGKGTYKKILHGLNKKILTHYEKRCLKFGGALFCSEQDRMKMAMFNGSNNIFVVPNIYHNDSFNSYDFGNGFQNNNTLLFVGTLNYIPNYNGLKWFIENVFYDFKRKYSDAKLIVVGRFHTKNVENMFNSRDGIELHCNVADVKEYYRQCRAVVVPLLIGGGTRIKILEAALANRPILSTHIGAEGLDLVNDTDLLLFENALDFSNQYAKLLNRDMYNSLVNNAKKVVLTKYSLQRFNDAMGKVLNELNHTTSE
jgi:glycosyltransferase involved in cell wall biosynthesis